MNSDSFTCRICGTSCDNLETFTATEVRFGWGEGFEYVKCPACGTVQIRTIPDDLDRYYSGEYYSLQTRSQSSDNSLLRSLVRRFVVNYRLTGRGLVGRLLTKVQPDSFEWIVPHTFTRKSSIIDIGCGTGRLVLKLAQCGFRNIGGVEPYIGSDIVYKVNRRDVVIRKGGADSLSGTYDVLILSHVLEHVANPDGFVQTLKKLMHSGSYLVVSLPLLSSFAWKEYGIRSLPFADCPRHLHIMTYDGFCSFAKKHGLRVVYNKPYFSESAVRDVSGNVSGAVAGIKRRELSATLLKNNDTGLNHIWLQRIDG